jgi:hypothetical protein
MLGATRIIRVDFAGGNQSSNAGFMLLRGAERNIGACRRLAETMPDRRDPDYIRHLTFEVWRESRRLRAAITMLSTSTGCATMR